MEDEQRPYQMNWPGPEGDDEDLGDAYEYMRDFAISMLDASLKWSESPTLQRAARRLANQIEELNLGIAHQDQEGREESGAQGPQGAEAAAPRVQGLRRPWTVGRIEAAPEAPLPQPPQGPQVQDAQAAGGGTREGTAAAPPPRRLTIPQRWGSLVARLDRARAMAIANTRNERALFQEFHELLAENTRLVRSLPDFGQMERRVASREADLAAIDEDRQRRRARREEEARRAQAQERLQQERELRQRCEEELARAQALAEEARRREEAAAREVRGEQPQAFNKCNGKIGSDGKCAKRYWHKGGR